MTRNSPSLWDGGIQWAAASANANGYWQASTAPGSFTGKPVLSVGIAGLRRGSVQEASWTLGRPDWMSVLSPNTASMTFAGTVSANVNDSVVVSVEIDDSVKDTHADPLWVGRVDTVTTTLDVAGKYWTTITATDLVGILGNAKAPTSIAGGSLEAVVEALALQAGVVLDVTLASTDVFTLLGDSSVSSTVLDYINRCERTRNAVLMMDGAGRLRFAARDAGGFVSWGSGVTVNLTGVNSPSSWVTELSVDGVINDWDWTDEAASWHSVQNETTAANYAASQKAYGKRSFFVSDMLRGDAVPYADISASGGNAMWQPRATVTAGVFPIKDQAQAVLFLDPLDRVIQGSAWMVMSVAHSASRSGWTVTITAARTDFS